METLDHWLFDAGTHTLRITAGDHPSGVSFVRLLTPSGSAARRVILTK